MNPGAEVITVNLRKDFPDQSWGFRLQGGSDFTTPLSVQTVNPGGVADNCGLCAGDAVLSINQRPSDELEHEEAKRMILMAGTQVTMVVQRGAVSVWKPKVTPMSQLRPGEVKQPTANGAGGDTEPYVQRTSLAANKQEFKPIGTGYNRAAKPFTGFGGGASPASVTPSAQYNSPGAPGGQFNSPDPPSGQFNSPAAPGGQFSSPGFQQQDSQTYMPNISSLRLDSDHHHTLSSNGVTQPLPENQQLSVPNGTKQTSQQILSPTLIAVQAVEQQKNPEKRHRPVSPRYAALNAFIDQEEQKEPDDEKSISHGVNNAVKSPSYLPPPSGNVRSVSPTLMLIQQEEETQRREEEAAAAVLKGAQTSSTMVEPKEGEEVRYHGYMDHSKQSRSFKVLQSEMEDGGNGGNDVPAPPSAAPMPSGIRSVKAPTSKPPGERSQNSQYMTCKACGTLIAGVFVKISGEPMHPECYKCVGCGKNLKNQGYFRVNEKLYCDVCARSAAQPPSGDMYAQPVYR